MTLMAGLNYETELLENVKVRNGQALVGTGATQALNYSGTLSATPSTVATIEFAATSESILIINPAKLDSGDANTAVLLVNLDDLVIPEDPEDDDLTTWTALVPGSTLRGALARKSLRLKSTTAEAPYTVVVTV